MSQTALPSTPPATPSAAAFTLGLVPGQSLWLCLPPGSALQATQGEVSVQFAPSDCGYALHTRPQARLGAGDPLPGSWTAHQAVWVQVQNTLRCPAEIQVTEAAPAPRVVSRTVQQLLRSLRLLRSAFARRSTPANDRAFGNLPALR